MFKVALKLAAMPALMLVAMPAHAAETLSPSGLTIASAANPFLSADVYRYDWYAKQRESNQLVLFMIDLDNPFLGPVGRVGPAAGPVVTIMPEPMSWALMIAGMTAVGWSIRSQHRRTGHPISFV